MNQSVVFVSIVFMACCHSYKNMATGCEHNGKMYKDGERFKDGCNHCACIGKAVRCTRMTCSPKDSGIKGVCTYNGKKYKVGDRFKMSCNNCNCGKKGVIACTWKFCPRPQAAKSS